MDRQIFLNVFLFAAIVCIFCRYEGEGLPHQLGLQKSLNILEEKPTFNWNRFNIMQRMARTKRAVDENSIQDANELDESQPQFSEDTEASNLRDVASPCSGAASGAAKQQELHCGNATDDIELAARSSSDHLRQGVQILQLS